MVSIKSLLLNFFTSLLFTFAFLFLISAVSSLLLPGELQKLNNQLVQKLPDILVNSSFFKNSVEMGMLKDVPLDNATDFNDFISVAKSQCAVNVTSELQSVCTAIERGEITDRGELVRVITEEVFKPQIRVQLKKSLDQAMPIFNPGKKFVVLLFLGFGIMFLLGSLIIFLDLKDYGKTVSRILSYLSGFSISVTLGLAVVLLVLPSVTNSIVNETIANLGHSLSAMGSGNLNELAVPISEVFRLSAESMIKKMILEFSVFTGLMVVLKLVFKFVILPRILKKNKP